MEKNTQTVRVVDEHGTVIGYTYPKRAKGLVKKCRAKFVTDNEIRLYKQSLTYENMEDNEMDEFKKINYLTINTRDWYPDMNDPNTQGNFLNNGFRTNGCWERFMISNPLTEAVPATANMVEILSVGSFDWDKLTRVASEPFQLEPDTEYQLVFWLNGGENDRSDEICNLEILYLSFDQTKYTNRICYRLNRNYIKPQKKYKGWEYYVLPFRTDDIGYIKLRFVADRAPMAIMEADVPQVYENMEDVLDPFEGKRPQRHNIVFEDGWPRNTWYSTEALTNGTTESVGVRNTSGQEVDEEINDRIDDLEDSIDDLKDQQESFSDRIIDLSDRLIDLADRVREMSEFLKQK